MAHSEQMRIAILAGALADIADGDRQVFVIDSDGNRRYLTDAEVARAALQQAEVRGWTSEKV